HVCIEHGEDDRNQTETDGQREHGRRGERAAPPEAAPRVRNVSPELLHQDFPPRVANVILDRSGAAQPDPRRARRVAAAHARLHAIVDGSLQELLELVVELPFHARAPEDCSETAEEPSHPTHQISPAEAWRIRAIAAVWTSQ